MLSPVAYTKHFYYLFNIIAKPDRVQHYAGPLWTAVYAHQFIIARSLHFWVGARGRARRNNFFALLNKNKKKKLVCSPNLITTPPEIKKQK